MEFSDLIFPHFSFQDDVSGMLSYAFQVVMSLIQNRAFRNTVLRCLVSLYRNLETPDYVNMCQCLIFLDDAQAVAELLIRLDKGSADCKLMSNQIAFDLYESATQQFTGRVQQALKATAPIPGALMVKPIVKAPSAVTAVTAGTDAAVAPETAAAVDEPAKNPDEQTERSVDSLVRKKNQVPFE